VSTYIAPRMGQAAQSSQHTPTSTIPTFNFDWLTEPLAVVPDTVWAAITASLLTLTGVILSNRNSRKQLKIQLDRQELENRHQRKSELRRSVYLQFCDTLPRTKIFYTCLANDTMNESSVERSMLELGSITNKIQLIGEPAASELASKLSNEFAMFWGEALQESREAHNKALEETLKRQSLETLQTNLDVKRRHLDTASESERIKLTKELVKYHSEYQKLKKSLDVICSERERLRRKYIKWAVERMETPQNLAIELTAELRQELETSSDKNQLIDRMNKSNNEVREIILKGLN